MKLQDYLHLYIGCKMLCTNKRNSDVVRFGKIGRLSTLMFNIYCNGDWRPILRKLSSITLEEFKQCVIITNPADRVEGATQQAFIEAWMDFKKESMEGFDFYGVPASKLFNLTRYLLSCHFDLFGLIEAGLAIDATTISN